MPKKHTKSNAQKESQENKSNNKEDVNHSGKSMYPVFRLKPRNGRKSAVIKFVGSIRDKDKLGDEVYELKSPIHPDADVVGRHAIPIDDAHGFECVARIYRSNIIGDYIVAGTRYPCMRLTVEYNRSMVSGALFDIFWSIDIDKEFKKGIKSNNEYVNLRFPGNWVQHLNVDDEMIENYERFLDELLENEAFNKIQSDPNIDMGSMTDDEISEWCDKYTESEKEFYTNLIRDHDVKFESMDKLRDYFVELATSKRFHNFVTVGLKCREIHRRKEYKIEDNNEYVVPKHITKLDALKQDMLESGELLLEEDL